MKKRTTNNNVIRVTIERTKKAMINQTKKGIIQRRKRNK